MIIQHQQYFAFSIDFIPRLTSHMHVCSHFVLNILQLGRQGFFCAGEIGLLQLLQVHTVGILLTLCQVLCLSNLHTSSYLMFTILQSRVDSNPHFPAKELVRAGILIQVCPTPDHKLLFGYPVSLDDQGWKRPQKHLVQPPHVDQDPRSRERHVPMAKLGGQVSWAVGRTKQKWEPKSPLSLTSRMTSVPLFIK